MPVRYNLLIRMFREEAEMPGAEKRKQQVCDLLLMPIVCDDRRRCKPVCKHNVILTGQRYCSSCLDEDMSDFAIGFYEIVYGQHPRHDQKGHLVDLEFAGDTMNSFENTACKVLGPKEKCPPKDQWPAFLRE